MRKGGLGKGLDAIIPSGLGSLPDGGALQIPVDQIDPNPRQPRYGFNLENLNELAASIKEHGVLQPLIVTQEAGSERYTLVAGERRLRASQLAGLQMVPVILRQVTDQLRLELALIENVQREDLTPLETAEAFQHLSEEFKLSHEEIAARVGKSRVAVTNTIRLLKLPEAVRQALADGKITEGHARALLGLENPTAQLAALQVIFQKDLTVRQTEELVRHYNGLRPAPAGRKPALPEISALEERLRSSLGTRVTLRHGKKGGTLTIHYYSDEELNALVAMMLKE